MYMTVCMTLCDVIIIIIPVSQSIASSRPSPVRAFVELQRTEGTCSYTQLMNILNISSTNDIHIHMYNLLQNATHKVKKNGKQVLSLAGLYLDTPFFTYMCNGTIQLHPLLEQQLFYTQKKSLNKEHHNYVVLCREIVLYS